MAQFVPVMISKLLCMLNGVFCILILTFHFHVEMTLNHVLTYNDLIKVSTKLWLVYYAAALNSKAKVIVNA